MMFGRAVVFNPLWIYDVSEGRGASQTMNYYFCPFLLLMIIECSKCILLYNSILYNKQNYALYKQRRVEPWAYKGHIPLMNKIRGGGHLPPSKYAPHVGGCVNIYLIIMLYCVCLTQLHFVDLWDEIHCSSIYGFII